MSLQAWDGFLWECLPKLQGSLLSPLSTGWDTEHWKALPLNSRVKGKNYSGTGYTHTQNYAPEIIMLVVMATDICPQSLFTSSAWNEPRPFGIHVCVYVFMCVGHSASLSNTGNTPNAGSRNFFYISISYKNEGSWRQRDFRQIHRRN
jgi:hypothetical protein